MSKFKVYFNEYNLLMGSGGILYLPFVSGILAANAKKINKLKENYKFKKFIFSPDSAENIIKKYYDEKPDIVIFSISMWNENLSLKVAEILKKKWNPLIIFGGSSCPHIPIDYFKKYKFIDIAVRAEGEDAFNEILIRYMNGKNFDGIPNVAYRDKKGSCKINYNNGNFSKDLDIYPSPYLSGEFDYLFKDKKKHNYQVIIETNRGCPFLCTYCYWGRGGTTTKYRFHSLERVFAEIDWIGKKKIKYILNADSNFGMHRRDIQIAEKLVETKLKTNYPEKFRTCWGKNTSEQIYRIASLLNLHDLEKGITIARQTNSKEALLNVKRDNIKLEAYADLEKKFNHLQIPVYVEMILGLPGETNESWIHGLCDLVDKGINNQIFVYHAEVYPNTELNEKGYRKKYGIKSTKIQLNEIHSSPREQAWLNEYQEIVTETSSMTKKDWQQRSIFSIILILFHSFKLGFYFLNYFINELKIPSEDFLKAIFEKSNKKDTPFIYKNVIEEITGWTNKILNGQGRGIYNPNYSDVYLDIEEIVFLKLSKNFTKFYSELDKIIKILLGEKRYIQKKEIIKDIKKYQLLRMPTINGENKMVEFNYNITEYMFACRTNEKVKLKKNKNVIKSINCKNYGNDYHSFTKYKIIWARNSDRIKNDINYDNNKLEKIRNEEMRKNIDLKNIKPQKSDLFEKLNKFEKYSSIDTKNNKSL